MNKYMPSYRQKGALAVEAAFVLPVVIAGAMMFMELANIGLTIDMGNTALERAIQDFRTSSSKTSDIDSMEKQIRQNMAAASHGYLSQANIASVSVERFNSLDAMGGGQADEEDEDSSSSSGSSSSSSQSSSSSVPVWRITVDVRKDFITPIPRLLVMDNATFYYRYQQLLGYLPAESDQ
ncbi:hypothetical protein KIK84_10340 [Curvibacter sp. CHRR-16]|uniref:hypothetical protein n=1 Tax=Curvibacter sp. CHRR-16 TaxID=2835872 RepID=UPI001BDAAAC6|nr:hypothetical protein [Curvibacter sp. CHRR-16]MBT0570729.1 hypothetical protein [Curvibacter sp. CHRR-16]